LAYVRNLDQLIQVSLKLTLLTNVLRAPRHIDYIAMSSAIVTSKYIHRESKK